MSDSSETGDRKTGRPGDTRTPAYEFIDDGGKRRLVIRSYELARQFLRLQEGTRQAGFSADIVQRSRLRQPMLYTEGDEHRRQRRLAASFFTPRAVSERHYAMIENTADDLCTALETEGGGEVDMTSFRLAMTVVAQVVGLTDSNPRRMEKLLERFFDLSMPEGAGRWLRFRTQAKSLWYTVRFHVGHVRPAIRARKKEPRDDVISSLITTGEQDQDILIECLTYAAAGMVTTRQLIAVAVWHLIERDDLRERFLGADHLGRREIINEIVRLDTVAGNLLRTTTAPIPLTAPDGDLEIPSGTLVDIQVRPVNADPAVFGDDAMQLCPGRSRQGKAPSTGLAFGEGHHSCPGEHLALEETDVFLRRFFQTTWRMEGTPTIGWNDVVLAYDIRKLVVRPVGG